ncbi:trans-resveratrol di-O-methyltransferase-like [Phoenix dactylifera]|uniref:Trans-resveratrol di-O-methyltransferase-like n=1 Tax=Phoenix dactylifera TaxID=42345 RepID=A0A8B7CX11_PHODC|nr:trans-resveratrol di-O-methyltransferase-like [Phoenix dactylifera]
MHHQQTNNESPTGRVKRVARMALEATADELLHAQAHVFHHALAHVGSMGLKCAIQLGIPDAIHAQGRPLTITELASFLPVAPTKSPALRRLMRMLAHTGFFSVEKDPNGSDEHAYSLTPNSKILLKDSPTSLASCVLFCLDSTVLAPFHFLAPWLQADQPHIPFEMSYGKPVFEMTGDDPAFNRLFNEAMASDSCLAMKSVVARCKDAFQGVSSLVDVGGGDGTSARAIAEAFPSIKRIIVYDLPHVIATVPKSPRVEAIAGNMFEHIPPAQAAFLKLILHDWTDEQCVKILKLCKEAIPEREDGGKVLILDIVMNASSENSATMTEMQLFWDIQMLCIAAGKERQEHEWRKIFFEAGFTNYKISSLGTRSLIEVFP